MRLYNAYLLSQYIRENRLSSETARMLEPELTDDAIARFSRLSCKKIKSMLGHENESVVNYTLYLDGQAVAVHIGNPCGALADVSYTSAEAEAALLDAFPLTLQATWKGKDSPFSADELVKLDSALDLFVMDLSTAARREESIRNISKNMLIYGEPTINPRKPLDHDLGGMTWDRLSISQLLNQYGEKGAASYRDAYQRLLSDLSASDKPLIVLAPVAQLKKAAITLTPQSLVA